MRCTRGGYISALISKPSKPEPKTRTPPLPDKPAVVPAGDHGHRFAYRLDSAADAVAISDAIVKYLGDKGFFLFTMLPTKGKHFKAVAGTVSNLWATCKSVRS